MINLFSIIENLHEKSIRQNLFKRNISIMFEILFELKFSKSMTDEVFKENKKRIQQLALVSTRMFFNYKDITDCRETLVKQAWKDAQENITAISKLNPWIEVPENFYSKCPYFAKEVMVAESDNGFKQFFIIFDKRVKGV